MILCRLNLYIRLEMFVQVLQTQNKLDMYLYWRHSVRAVTSQHKQNTPWMKVLPCQELTFEYYVGPSDAAVIILAIGSEVRGFKPDRGRWIFQSVKILNMTSFGREVKPLVTYRRFTERKKPQTEIRASEQNLSDFSRSVSEAT